MDKNKIIKIRREVVNLYITLNDLVSEGKLPLMDLVYPNHDGQQDLQVVSELMLLSDCLSSLSYVANDANNKIKESYGE